VNFAVHFIKARSSLILRRPVLRVLYITLLVGVMGGKKRIVGWGGGRDGEN